MEENTFTTVVTVAPNAQLHCFYCPNTRACGNISGNPSISWAIDEEEDWILHICCNDCLTEWYICRKCDNVRNILKTKSAIVNHRFRYHKRKRDNEDASAVVKSTTTAKSKETESRSEKSKVKKKKKRKKDKKRKGKPKNDSDYDSDATAVEKKDSKTDEEKTDDRFIRKKTEDVVDKDIKQVKEDDLLIEEVDENIKEVKEDDLVIEEVDENIKEVKGDDLVIGIEEVDENEKVVNENEYVINYSEDDDDEEEKKKKQVMNRKSSFDESLLKELLNDKEIHKLNNRTAYYYAYDVNSNGNKYLVSKALGNHEKDFGSIGQEEVNLQLCIAKLVSSLTDKQQRGFVSVLSRLTTLYIHKQSTNLPAQICNIPGSKADLDRIYTRSSTSISKNLPIPVCLMLKEHSFVSIIDCIADFLMNNKDDIVDSSDFTSYVEASDEESNPKMVFNNLLTVKLMAILDHRKDKFKVKYDHPILPIFLFFWSDDFDPNRGIKSNRQSVWIKTCTIKCLSKQMEIIESTYPISVSKKQCDHEEVERMIYNDIKQLSSGDFLLMYSRTHEGPVYVHADVYCYKMDQPERRSNLKLLAGNSNLHGRFGYLLDVKSKVDVIRSCEKCTISITKEIQSGEIAKYGWRSKTCTKCTSWMYNENSELLDYEFEKDTPGIDQYIRNGKIKCRTINLYEMSEAISTFKENLFSGEWTPNQCNLFLKYNGFNVETCNRMVSNALTEKQLKENKEEDQDESNINTIQEYSCERPSIWYFNNNLDAYPDVPMHLLFLGIVKKVTIEITDWLKSRNQHSLFCKNVHGIFDEIKLMNLNWCKILPYSEEKFGGWVSENFLAFCRLSNWFYQMLDYLPDKKKYEDPVTEQSKWTKKENQAWLGARGIKANGNAKSLQNKVKEYIESGNIPKIIVNDMCEVREVQTMTKSMTRMCRYCMTYWDDIDAVVELEANIRFFLICYDKFNSSISSSKYPGWVTSYNFLSLLNLPDLINKFGNLRILWEGGQDGEGYLKGVKNELKGGLVRQWQVWLMNNLLEEKTFNSILNENDDNNRKSEILEYKIYPSKNKIMENIKKHKPLSGVMMKDDNNEINTYIAFRKERKILGLEVVVGLEGEKGVRRNGLVYRELYISKEIIDLTEDNKECLRVGILILPMFPLEFETEYARETVDEKQELFTMIAADWSAKDK